MQKKNRYLTTEQKRYALKLVYAKKEWIDKVNAMSNKQVYAIFDKMKMDGIINFNDDGSIFFRTKEEAKELKERRQGFHQMNFDDWAKQQEIMKIEKERKEKEKLRNGKI